MSWIDESRALRASVPSEEGLARLSEALGEPVEIVGPLHGGVASSTHELRTPTRRLVLKRFRTEDVSPTACELEWSRLQVALGAPVPTPEPVALDAGGAWFGRGALVMTHLPGEVVYPPVVDALATSLAALHSTPLREPVPEAIRRPGLWTYWVQTVAGPPGLLEAIAALPEAAASLPSVLCHCDFHPGNVLVEDGAVSGVVDWSGARFVPAGFDVGLTRCDLALEPGGDAPDRFLAAYERAAGATVEHLRLWDAFAAARAIEHGAGWIDAWTETGVQMTAELLHDRAWAFAEAALS